VVKFYIAGRTYQGADIYLSIYLSMAASKNRSSLALKSLNHISRNCVDLAESMEFYENVLGFMPIKRPGSFDFNGAWLFAYGMGIHLLQAEKEENIKHTLTWKKREINPRDDHISFQCEDIVQVEKDLQERNIKCTRQVVEEGGIMVDQLFFHDPDGFMIEVCNCEKLPVVPLTPSVASCGLRRCASSTMSTIITTPTSSSDTITQHLQADYRASSEQYAMCV
jgi:catechol 2,3-dioxygenase-like lactoylglutathione lyase family enzyme